VNKGSSATGNSYITWPAQGIGDRQFIGFQFNMMYLDVRFVLQLATGVSTRPWETIRLEFLKAKDLNSNTLTSRSMVLDHLDGGTSPFAKLDFRTVKVLYDRIWTWKTGFSTAVPNVESHVDNAQKFFKFVIPMKHTFNNTVANSFNQIPYDYYIRCYSVDTNNCLQYHSLQTYMFYRDP